MIDEYTANMHLRTLRVRCLNSMRPVRRQRWTDNGHDPRDTATNWYWRAVAALNYRTPAPL